MDKTYTSKPYTLNITPQLQTLRELCQKNNIQFKEKVKIPFYMQKSIHKLDTENMVIENNNEYLVPGHLMMGVITMIDVPNCKITRIRDLLRMYCYFDTPTQTSPMVVVPEYQKVVYIRYLDDTVKPLIEKLQELYGDINIDDLLHEVRNGKKDNKFTNYLIDQCQPYIKTTTDTTIVDNNVYIIDIKHKKHATGRSCVKLHIYNREIEPNMYLLKHIIHNII